MLRRIMVTGSNGYIGCVMCRELKERGYEVVGVDSRLFPKNFDIQGYPYEVEGVEYLIKDIRDLTEKDFKGIDVLIHLAGLSNDPVGDINDSVTRKINVYATVEMVSLAKKAGVKKLVFSSSCSVYGFSPMESPVFFVENSAKNPVSTYAESKLICEGALNQLRDRNFQVNILRNATVYGPSPRMRFDLLINAMVASSYFNNTIVFYSCPLVKRPLIHIRDLCEVFINFVEQDVGDDTFNVGRTVDNYSISDVAVLVAQAFYDRFKRDIHFRYEIDNSDPRSYLVSFKKLEEKCGRLIDTEIAWSIRQMIDHFVANFSPEDEVYNVDTTFHTINHLTKRLQNGEIDGEFRVLKSGHHNGKPLNSVEK